MNIEDIGKELKEIKKEIKENEVKSNKKFKEFDEKNEKNQKEFEKINEKYEKRLKKIEQKQYYGLLGLRLIVWCIVIIISMMIYMMYQQIENKNDDDDDGLSLMKEKSRVCKEDNDCEGERGICFDDECVECVIDYDCGKNKTKLYCFESQCVGCIKDKHCGLLIHTPKCDNEKKDCVECLNDEDCKFNNGDNKCINKVCVEQHKNSHEKRSSRKLLDYELCGKGDDCTSGKCKFGICVPQKGFPPEYPCEMDSDCESVKCENDGKCESLSGEVISCVENFKCNEDDCSETVNGCLDLGYVSVVKKGYQRCEKDSDCKSKKCYSGVRMIGKCVFL